MENKIDYKVDPLSIKVDQTKQDTRRDAWDRDYMGYYYLREEPKSKKTVSYTHLTLPTSSRV